MRVAGIVAEYNPFHNGHAYLIEKVREQNKGCEATHVVAVMSGSFVQRGEPAILTKFDRAAAALAGGADLVLELPVPWALSSAEGFAFGAVSLLDALGCVDMLAFGSEAGDTASLQKAATALETTRFLSLLKYYLERGISAPEAQQKALAEIAGNSAAQLLSTPNNTLAIEYLKALNRLGSSIKPYTVKRYGTAHDSSVPLGNFASASYLRSLLTANRPAAILPFLPAPCAEVLSAAMQAGRICADPKQLERAVLSRLRTLSLADLSGLPGISEGLENRLYNAIRKATDLTTLEEAVKTKRYPLTRVRRLIWNAYIGIPDGYAATRPPYARILAANSRGKELLSASHSQVPLLYRAAQVSKMSEDIRRLWALENRATDLHALAFPIPLPCGLDCTTGLLHAPQEC